ncbi:MAG: 30S ribosomal protein S13 [Parcubacteria group bacterium]|nr:30S ribosomal protein S13 [Parcubacteria group bacterium]
MVRIAGVNLPDAKRIEIGLTYVFGIGKSTSRVICAQARIDLDRKVKELTPREVDLLRGIIEQGYRVEGELKREIGGNIKRLKEIGCYRGTRHAKRLPVRGQRTKTNSRTIRGNVRHIAGSGRKKADQKT